MILTCFVVVLLFSVVWSFEAPEEKKDQFASTACPAFLTFTNAAFLVEVTVELPCHCKPEEVKSVVWFFRKHWSSFDDTRALTDNQGNKLLDTSEVPHNGDLRNRFSIRMFSLLIFRARLEDSGLYICGSTKKDFFYGYDLDIQESPKFNFPSESRKKKSYRNSFVIFSNPMYKIFISFRPWSMCDRCGAPGEQVRIGLCYVHSRFLHVRYRQANQTVASCGSEGVPRSFSHIHPEPQVEIRSCEVICPPEPSPPSKLTALMTFLGYSSAGVPGPVPVFYLSQPAGELVTLTCPGAHQNMVVGWDQEAKPIYRSQKTSPGGSPPRITVDIGHHLVFNPAKNRDSGVYYCWLQGRRVAQIRLLVYAHLRKRRTLWTDPEFIASMKTMSIYFFLMTAAFCLLLFFKIAYGFTRNSGSWCSAPAGEEVNR